MGTILKSCALCYLSKMNNMERKSQMVNDDDFCFDVSPTQGQDSSFSRTTVNRNTETGEIQGWQEFYELVCMDGPALSSEDQAQQQQVLKQWEQAIRHTYVLKSDTIPIEASAAEQKITIENVISKERIEITAVRDPQSGTVTI